MAETIRLATRGSDLALRQATAVAERLAGRHREVELVEVETRGDQVRDELIHRLGKTGAFVRSLDRRVLDGEVDAAVHSMKDVPTEFPDDLVVAGVPRRAPAGDVLVTPDGRALDELPDGAVVGTSSLRRRAQLLAARPDLQVAPLRGNVDTRVEKLLAPHLQREHERRLEVAEGDGTEGDEDDESGADEDDDGDEDDESGADEDDDGDEGDDTPGDASGDERTVEEWFDDLSAVERRALEREVDTRYDAIVLAEAGLARMGLLDALACERLRPTEFVPAPGQGALALTALAGGDVGEFVHDRVDHPRTRTETTVERTVLEELGGGCVAPLGVYAVLQGAYVHAVVRVLDRDGTGEIRETRDLPVERHAEAAREFARDLARKGAADLVEQARRREDGEAKRG